MNHHAGRKKILDEITREGFIANIRGVGVAVESFSISSFPSFRKNIYKNEACKRKEQKGKERKKKLKLMCFVTLRKFSIATLAQRTCL